MKNFAKAAVVILLLQASVSAAAPEPAPYEIGVILPLTGSGTFLGHEMQAALFGVERMVNRTGGIRGQSIKFVVQDDQTSPQLDVQLVNAMIAKRVPLIMGSSLVASCSAVAPLTKDGPLLYCLSPGFHPEGGSYVFSSSVSTVDLIDATVRYLRDRGLRRIALFTSTDASGQDAERSFKTTLALPENSDVAIVDAEHFNGTDVTVSAQMARIKSAGPQALIAWASGTPVATLLRGANEAGLAIPVITSPANSSSAQINQYAGFLPKDLFCPAVPSLAEDQVRDVATRKAIAEYKSTLSSGDLRANYLSSVAWDPALLIVAALRTLGTNASAGDLRNYLLHTTGFVGVNGPYNFQKYAQRGLGIGAVYMTRWDARQNSWIAASGAAGAPMHR